MTKPVFSGLQLFFVQFSLIRLMVKWSSALVELEDRLHTLAIKDLFWLVQIIVHVNPVECGVVSNHCVHVSQTYIHAYMLTQHKLNSYSPSALTCDRLDNPSNGHVILTGVTVNSVATYICSSGFVLVGEDTRTCQPNGEWSGQEPVCSRKLSYICMYLLTHKHLHIHSIRM